MDNKANKVYNIFICSLPHYALFVLVTKISYEWRDRGDLFPFKYMKWKKQKNKNKKLLIISFMRSISMWVCVYHTNLSQFSNDGDNLLCF